MTRIGKDGLTLTVDRSFGDGGVLQVDESNQVEKLARGNAGRLLAAGHRVPGRAARESVEAAHQ